MKTKFLFILLTGLCTASCVLCQGVVNFANFVSPYKVATNNVVGGPTAGLMTGPAGSYYFGLFIAPPTQVGADPLLPGWTFTGNYATNSATRAGSFIGNYTTDPGVTIAGYAPGSTANFMIAGWSADMGHDWSGVQSVLLNPAPGPPYGPWSDARYGVSPVTADIILGGGPIPVPNVLAGSFTVGLLFVPEPSALSLLSLGAVGLLLRARIRIG